MANTKKKGGSGKRFGPRYSSQIRQKVSKIDSKAKKSYECPLCHKKKVKKVSIGIWYCHKCDTKFAGRAFSFNE